MQALGISLVLFGVWLIRQGRIRRNTRISTTEWRERMRRQGIGLK
jgi:hypothetical protein